MKIVKLLGDRRHQQNGFVALSVVLLAIGFVQTANGQGEFWWLFEDERSEGEDISTGTRMCTLWKVEKVEMVWCAISVSFQRVDPAAFTQCSSQCQSLQTFNRSFLHRNYGRLIERPSSQLNVSFQSKFHKIENDSTGWSSSDPNRQPTFNATAQRKEKLFSNCFFNSIIQHLHSDARCLQHLCTHCQSFVANWPVQMKNDIISVWMNIAFLVIAITIVNASEIFSLDLKCIASQRISHRKPTLQLFFIYQFVLIAGDYHSIMSFRFWFHSQSVFFFIVFLGKIHELFSSFVGNLIFGK